MAHQIKCIPLAGKQFCEDPMALLVVAYEKASAQMAISDTILECQNRLLNLLGSVSANCSFAVSRESNGKCLYADVSEVEPQVFRVAYRVKDVSKTV